MKDSALFSVLPKRHCGSASGDFKREEKLGLLVTVIGAPSWPSGITEVLKHVAAAQILRAVEPK